MLPKNKKIQNEGIKVQQVASSGYFEKAPTNLTSSTLQVFIKRVKDPGKWLLARFWKDLFEKVTSSVEGEEFPCNAIIIIVIPSSSS